jgi:hypothetical protein
MVSLTSLNLSRSISTTENGRPEREARFHSADSASQKKRRVLIPVRPSVMDCCCSFWNTKGIVQSRGQQVGEGVEDENVLRSECALVAAFDVERAQQRFAVGDGNAQHGTRSGQNRAHLAFHAVLHQSPLAGASHASQNADAQRNALPMACAVAPASALISISLVP